MKTRHLLFLLLFLLGGSALSFALSRQIEQLPDELKDKVHESAEGFITVHHSEKKIYFEIPDSIMGRDLLLAVRASELSSNRRHVAAGQMRHNPLLIRFTADENQVYLHQLVSSEHAAFSDPVRKSLDRNNLVPVIDAFPIQYRSGQSCIIDFTDYLNEPITPVSPFADRARPGTLNPSLTSFLDVRAFEKNIEIKTRLGFRGREPFLAIMQRSLVLLPEQPMQPRLNDPRVGYFNEGQRLYDSDQLSVESFAYISRFDIRPAEEDLEAYKRGELVEPDRPIVFYVDDAFPEKWLPYVRAGVEDWQLAFEAIGFKNAIVAKDCPDDPDFDQNDIRHNTIRYVTTSSANAEGQRWIDPRSGEIIQADVVWYSNVTEKLYEWLFVQTAAANEGIRGARVSDEVMGPAIRYAIAHEVGHTLGLAHNFRSHYAYPVDSLRSATFTQAHGIFASIMDYARNNYIAQPGDEGVQFTPPIIGPYDMFAIKYGYKLIPEAADPFEEKPVLRSWIDQIGDDPVYWFRRNRSFSDPSSQSDALGDDVVKAGRYGADNVRVILENMVDWMELEDGDYSRLRSMHDALMKQYGHYLRHASAQVGGVYEFEGVYEEEGSLYRPVSSARQREALVFILDELFIQFDWMDPIHISSRIGSNEPEIRDMQQSTVETLFSRDKFLHLRQSASLSDDPYTIHEYLEDLTSMMFTEQEPRVSRSVQNVQLEAINQLRHILDNPDEYEMVENALMPALYHHIEIIENDLQRKRKRAGGELAAHYQYMLNTLTK
ncbi:MAG: zinc-dependent metalloprotease [Bacteroidales bacterium]